MNKYKTIRQHDSKDCGAACLCMISKYFGNEYTLQQLRKLTCTSQEGISILGLIEGAEKIGLLAKSFKGKVKDLKEYMSINNNPIILHLKHNHFVVVYKASENKVFINDPAKGKCKYTWEMLEKEWSGYIISFEKKEGFKIGAVHDNKYNVIWKILKVNRLPLMFISLFSIIIIGITICGAYVFQMLIDYGGIINEMYEHNDSNVFIYFLSSVSQNNTGKLLLFLICMFGIMSIVYAVRGRIVSLMSKKIDMSLIDSYVSKIYNSTIHDVTSRMSGEYLSRISDLISVRRMISDIVVSLVLDIFMIVVSIVILIQTNTYLFLLSIVTIILYTIVVIGLNGAFKSVNYEIMSINAEMQSYFKESLQGIEVVKANNLVEQIKTKFMQKYLMYTNCIYKGNMLGVISGSASLLIEQISNIVIIFGGFILIDAGTIMLGDLLSFYMILSCLINPVKDILSLQPTFQSGIIALDRIEDIQYMEEDQNKGLDEITDIWRIQFDNVCFHYPGKDELLKNISFTVEGDKKIAIIGKNGTGKSTLLKLILGFEKVDSGNLSINGINIQKINIQDVRDKISYVVQNNFLFADTIYNNVTFENDNYSINEIQKNSKLSGLDAFIREMPLGYETYVNENGDNLSVGQKQTIAIARALIRKPQLLILDEATSNLDFEREQKVIDNILKLPIPCIIITHNHNIISKVDEVIDLNCKE